MSFIDVLGDIGYGFTDGVNAAAGAYQNWDRARTSDVAASRQEDQYDADTDYDLFNAQAAANRAKLDYVRNQNQLGANQIGDKLDYYDPNTRADVAKMVEQYGGADTPEFRRAYADYLAGKGMLQTADPEYQRAQRETAAGQQVAAVLQKVPGYEDVHSVEMGEDGRVYGFKGEPDENGEYEVVDLPPAALRQYAALMGNTKPLGYDLKMQSADISNRAAAMGQFPQQGGQRNNQVRAAVQRNGGSLTQNQLLNAINAGTKAGVAQGLSPDQARAETLRQLQEAGVQLPPGLSGGQGSPVDVPNLSGGGPQQQYPQQRQPPGQHGVYTPGQFGRQMAQPRTQSRQPQGQVQGPPALSTPPYVPQQQSPLGDGGSYDFGSDPGVIQNGRQPAFYNEMMQVLGPQVARTGKMPAYTVQLLLQRGFPIGAIQQFLQYNAMLQNSRDLGDFQG